MKMVGATRESRRVERPASSSSGEAAFHAGASTWRRPTFEQWALELVTMALALVLIGAAAVFGLAVVSTGTSTPSAPTAWRSMPTNHDFEAGTFEPGLPEEGRR